MTMTSNFAFGFLNPTDQFAFQIGLPKIDLHLQLAGALAHFGLNVRQSGAAINLRLALAEQVQIRTVQEQNFHFDREIN